MKENITVCRPCGCEVEFVGATDYETGMVRCCMKHALVLSSDMEENERQLERQQKNLVKARAVMQAELNRRTVSN